VSSTKYSMTIVRLIFVVWTACRSHTSASHHTTSPADGVIAVTSAVDSIVESSHAMAFFPSSTAIYRTIIRINVLYKSMYLVANDLKITAVIAAPLHRHMISTTSFCVFGRYGKSSGL